MTTGAPRLTGEMTINERIVVWRKYRGMTREACANLVGRSLSWWKNIERGTHQLDRLSDLIAIAKMFRVPSLDDLTGPLDVPLHRDRGDHHARLAQVAHALQAAHSLTQNSQDEPPNLDDLRQRLDMAIELEYTSRRHVATVGGLLPDLLIQSALARKLSAETGQRRRADALDVRVNDLAAHWLRSVSAFELAAIAADRAMAAAFDADDSVSFALAAWKIAGVRKDQGQAESALELCHEALGGLEPALDSGSQETLAIYGKLMLQAGLSAGHLGDEGHALRSWDTGAKIAQRLRPGFVHPQTRFCAVDADVFHLRTWAALGNSRQVIASLPRIDLSAFPDVDGQGLTLIDSTRYYVSIRNDLAALKTLELAYQYAPELVNHNIVVREALRTMMLRDRRTITQDLHKMARRVGLFT